MFLKPPVAMVDIPWQHKQHLESVYQQLQQDSSLSEKKIYIIILRENTVLKCIYFPRVQTLI